MPNRMTARVSAQAWPAGAGADDHGLRWDGTRRVPLSSGWMAVLQAGAATAGITYRGPDGRRSTALPAGVKARGAGSLAALRAEMKTVRGAITRERSRIDGL